MDFFTGSSPEDDRVSPVEASFPFLPTLETALARFEREASLLLSMNDMRDRCRWYNKYTKGELIRIGNESRLASIDEQYKAVRTQRTAKGKLLETNVVWRGNVESFHKVVRTVFVGQYKAGNTIFSKPVDELIVRLIGKCIERVSMCSGVPVSNNSTIGRDGIPPDRRTKRRGCSLQGDRAGISFDGRGVHSWRNRCSDVQRERRYCRMVPED